MATEENKDDVIDKNDIVENNGNGGEGTGEGSDNLENTADPVEPEISEELALAFYKKRSGKDFTSLDEAFAERIVEVEVDKNPYKDILDDAETKSFLDYKKETGRGLNDYLKLQENINDTPDTDLAIAKAKSELGAHLKREDLITYIEEQTGVDVDSLDELSDLDKAKLARFVKDYKSNFLAEQEKYKTPVEKQTPAGEEVEMVTLPNGIKVEKSVYDDHLNKRQAYQKDVQVAVDSVAPTSLSIKIDNAGQEEILTFDYEYDAEDKKEMLSLTEDLDQTIAKLFRSEKGDFDYKAFAKAVWRLNPQNWEKEASAIAQKARAQGIEEVTKVANNVNLGQQPIPENGDKPGVRRVPVSELFNR